MDSPRAITPTTMLLQEHRSELVLSLALLGVLGVVLIPLPPVILDMLLAGNLGITILLLLVTLGVKHPLDISVFPSMLLLLTLFRLSLNVGTTRSILLDGSAGKIISTFGGFVVGGNLIVGLVIFLILIIIQFIVITKGANRVSEVSARFTLDALPGKQMAIDAELGAGFIDEKVARERRQLLMHETEFYGAMDGASKFVRGDAIAGLIVTAINLIGGIILGVSGGLSLGAAVRQYSILTVGDGLISQIPALVIATASGIVVTKAATEQSLGEEIGTQFLANTRPIATGAVILGAMAMVPGLPKLPFLMLAGVLGWYATNALAEPPEEEAPAETPDAPPVNPEKQFFDDFVQTDRACVELGARLIALVEPSNSRGLADRVPSLRRDLTRQYGFWIPVIRIRDNTQLPVDNYQILVNGKGVATGQLHLDKCLVLRPEDTPLGFDGVTTTDPTFGLPASWIAPTFRRRAELAGFTVVDPIGVLITHLGETLRRYAHELLSREDLQQLLEKLKDRAPTIVNEIKPDLLRHSTLHQVFVKLLEEQVPITDLERIIESALTHAAPNKSADDLTEQVRQHLGRSICGRFCDEQGRVRVIVFHPQVEMALRNALQNGELAIQPATLEKLIFVFGTHQKKNELDQIPTAVLVDRSLRRPLRNAIRRSLSELCVLAYDEIPTDMLITPVTVLDRDAIDVIALEGAPNTFETDVNAPEQA